jgi:hypothetical protein
VAGDVVSCQNVAKFVKNIMLGENAKGKKNRIDAKKHRLCGKRRLWRKHMEMIEGLIFFVMKMGSLNGH